jgi:hypothetical protein
MMASSGSTRKITVNQLLGAGGTATLASATITGDLTVDTNVLKVNTTTNRVGVNVTSPTTTLDVAGTTNISGGTSNARRLQFDASGVYLNYIESDGTAGAGYMVFAPGNAECYRIATGGTSTWSVGGSTAMTLNATGLGVGAVPSASKFLVSTGTSAGIDLFRSDANANFSGIRFRNSANSATNAQIGWNGNELRLEATTSFSLATNGVENRINVDGSGNVGIGVTPSAGKGCLQLVSGINFPATQVASSDANTLDDYEEGTWVPTIAAASGTPTTTTVNSAVYTKIGRIVVVQIDISIVNKGTASSSLIFSLPFNQTAAINTGAFRETSVTGFMGVLGRNGTTDAFASMYDNTTPWVNGYRIAGTYTYHV